MRVERQRVFNSEMQNTYMRRATKALVATAALAVGIAAAVIVNKWPSREPKKEEVVQVVTKQEIKRDAPKKAEGTKIKTTASIREALRGFRKTYEFKGDGICADFIMYEGGNGNVIVLDEEGKIFDKGRIIERIAPGELIYQARDGGEVHTYPDGTFLLGWFAEPILPLEY